MPAGFGFRHGAAGQNGQQVQHVGRCRYLAGTFHLVPNADAFPLGIHILPAQRQHFAGPGTGQQHHLNAGRNDRVLKLLHGGKPRDQLAFLQHVLLGSGLAQCLAGLLGLGRVFGRQQTGIGGLFRAPGQKHRQQPPCKAGGRWASQSFLRGPCLNRGLVKIT